MESLFKLPGGPGPTHCSLMDGTLLINTQLYIQKLTCCTYFGVQTSAKDIIKVLTLDVFNMTPPPRSIAKISFSNEAWNLFRRVPPR